MAAFLPHVPQRNRLPHGVRKWLYLMLVLWFILSWRPVVPIGSSPGSWHTYLQWGAFLCAPKMQKAIQHSFLVPVDAQVRCRTSWAGLCGCGGNLKAAILGGRNTRLGRLQRFSFFQIVGSFDMFAIVWLVFFTSAISWVKVTFQFDLSVSCSWMGVAFETILRSYTLAPLVLIWMLALPVVAARFRGLHLTDKKREQKNQGVHMYHGNIHPGKWVCECIHASAYTCMYVYMYI